MSDVLTPHYGAYYRGEETPHESGSPNPVPFLVVPPGALFNFHVQCVPALLNDSQLCANWQTMVQRLLEQAFDWLGFGAKTTGGYGQLQIDESARQERQEQLEEEAHATLPEQQRLTEEIHEMCSNPAAASTRNQAYKDRLAQIVDAAFDWPAEDQAALLKVASAALVHMGVKKKHAMWKALKALSEKL